MPLTRCDTALTVRRSLYLVGYSVTSPVRRPPRLARGSWKIVYTPFSLTARAPRPPSMSSEVVHTVSDVSGVQSHGGNRQRVPLERVRPRVGCGNVRTERKGNPESWWQHRLSCHFQFFKFCLLQPLGFGSPVLKPDFDLGFRQV